MRTLDGSSVDVRMSTPAKGSQREGRGAFLRLILSHYAKKGPEALPQKGVTYDSDANHTR